MFPTIIISSSTISSANSNFQEKQVGYDAALGSEMQPAHAGSKSGKKNGGGVSTVQ